LKFFLLRNIPSFLVFSVEVFFLLLLEINKNFNESSLTESLENFAVI